MIAVITTENVFAIIITICAIAPALVQWRAHTAQCKLAPEGVPTVDEHITEPMLEIAKRSAMLAHRAYGRFEFLSSAMLDGIDELNHANVLYSDDLSAMCIVCHGETEIVIVWRGTNLANREQVRANVDASLVDMRAGRFIVGRVHEGLHRQHDSVWSRLESICRDAIERKKVIHLTGHSQGGGLALLTCAKIAYLTAEPHPLSLVTFGAMRAGDRYFAKTVENAVPYHPRLGYGIQRYRNNNDIVPLVPPKSAGYMHAGRELYIWPNGAVTADPPLILKVIQRIKGITSRMFDGLRDHEMAGYAQRIQALEIRRQS
jgi:hypothetical protein